MKLKPLGIAIVTLILYLAQPFSAGQQTLKATGNVRLTATRINSPRLVEILNYGEVNDLNKKLDPVAEREQELQLLLWSVPRESDCRPDTHSVCSYHYYLAVHNSHNEGLGEAVYDLGEVGEISDIKWLKSANTNTARIRLLATNYPVDTYQQNKRLVRRQQAYELVISLDKLVVRPIK